MICPRCDFDGAHKIFEAPEDPMIWEVYRLPPVQLQLEEFRGRIDHGPEAIQPEV